MPFAPFGELPADPTVRIFFSGLLILQPSPDMRICEVFVNRSAPDHQLTIEIRKKRPGKPDFIMMRHVGPLAFALPPPGAPPAALPIHGFVIQVSPNSGSVKMYNPGSPSTEGQGLDLAIDLQSPQFHDGNVGAVDPLGGQPSILLDDGIFYTADTTSPAVTTVIKRGGNDVGTLNSFASLIGANLYLDENGTASVRWVHQGRLEGILLKRPDPATEPGASYEIYIVNDPLYETDSPAAPVHDEFREYYKILPAVFTQDQFQLVFNTVSPVPPSRGSTKKPCMSVIKSR
jgi:hypothetical protein